MPEITPGTILYRQRIVTLAQQLLSEQSQSRCIFFLGSGMGWAKDEHLPTGSELSSMLAHDCELDFPKPIPLATVSFYYEFYKTRTALNDFLISKLAGDDIPVSPATTRLVDIVVLLESLKKDPILVITTNYDRHFERAYKAKTGKDPMVVIYNGGRDPNEERISLHTGDDINQLLWKPHGTCLYKMHGCISDVGDNEKRNLVITEDDYINFLSNCLNSDPLKRVPFYVLARLSESPVIFVGYSLSDWNLRVIFKTTTEKRHRDCHAVQKPGADDLQYWDALVNFWGARKFSIINQTGEAFLGDLFKAVQDQAQLRSAAMGAKAV